MCCKLFKSIIVIFAQMLITNGVKVNLQGSVNIGKEVLDTINSYYMHVGHNSRRRSVSNPENDTITSIVEEQSLCEGTEFCTGDLETFVTDYVIALAKAAEGIFAGVIGSVLKTELETQTIIFEKELKEIAENVKNVIGNANSAAKESMEQHVWTNVVKQINAEFQKSVLNFVDKHLGAPESNAVKKKVKQKLIIAMVILEGKYLKNLCDENKVCDKSSECTLSLKILLKRLQHLSDDKLKEFMKTFGKVITDTSFYSHLDTVTANEFKIIVNDMASKDNVPTKEILAGVQKIVEARLRNSNITESLDGRLLHGILSDMDNFYTNYKIEGFQIFLASLMDWSKSTGNLSTDMHQLFQDITKQLSYQPQLLVTKIMKELRVFLEITVDPDK